MVQNAKILFLTRLYFPHIGGVEKHVAKLSEALSVKGYQIFIVTELHDRKLLQFEKHGSVSIYRIPVSDNLFLKKFYIWKWIFFHLRLFYDARVIHIHDVFYWVLPFRLFMPFKEIFMTFHGYEGYPIKSEWKVARRIAEILTNGNICVGEFMKKWYRTDSNFVIYGGVSLTRKTKEPNEYSAVFFGRLDDQTGILEYIKAYKKIKQVYPKFRMTVVGEGPLKKEISSEIKVLKFTDEVEDFILNNRYIFVSRYLSILEALVKKRTVIAVYDNPIKKDYLLMSPFKKYISIAKNSKEIADLVLKQIKKGHRKATINAGYEWAKEQTWEKVADKYLSLWGKGFS